MKACIYCHQDKIIKKGKRKDKQRYYCKRCRKSFQDDYRYKAWQSETGAMIFRLLKEGCGIRSTARVLGISKDTVQSRILKRRKQIKKPGFKMNGVSFEIDELWSYVGKKSNPVWITYAIEKGSGRVVGFVVGDRTKVLIKRLIDELLRFYPKRIYTDGLNIYPGLIPKAIHRVFRYCTNQIERKNLTLRTHIKRLSRRTLCYTKSQAHLEAHLRLYFWG